MTEQDSVVAFIGLGVMGYPIAGHLAAKGYSVRVFNRTEVKADDGLQSIMGQHIGSPRRLPIERIM